MQILENVNFRSVFAKNKFLRSAAGATRLIATSNSGRHILRSCPLRSVLNEGILCLATVNFVLVWNPTIAKFKTLPLPVEGRRVRKLGFGYDSFSHSYKVVAAAYGDICYSSRRFQVNILALGSDTNTKTWRTIGIPWLRVMSALGKFSSGVVPQPHYHEHANYSDLSLDVLKDCLCLVAIVNTGVHVWLMREHGIKESWTHLFTFSPKLGSLGYVNHVLRYKKKEPLRAVCILEDGQVLFDRYGYHLRRFC
ncbi:hypothetical protein Fmac_009488 [Flemingia macrophylla]|uniref:F-box associated beta-propeller type 3 domain-containing protein n=1 Tax=Flemingia macrophylla TaxID=520843 RepID=A0ABD1N0D4_9FABA